MPRGSKYRAHSEPDPGPEPVDDTTYVDITSAHPVVVRVNPAETEPPPVEPPTEPPPPEGGFDDLWDNWSEHPSCVMRCKLDDVDEINALAARNYEFKGEPRHFIDDATGSLVIKMLEGDKALPNNWQIRLEIPGHCGPADASCLTFVWDWLGGPETFSGGKQFSTRSAANNKIYEIQPALRWNDPDHDYVGQPYLRVYKDVALGGNGNNNCLSTDSWSYRNTQPRRKAPQTNNDQIWARDHVLNASSEQPLNAFLTRPMEWTRFRLTLDWSGEVHGVWLWLETEETPMTCLLEEQVDDIWRSFRCHIRDGDQPVRSFVFEYNNSNSINTQDNWVAHRNLMAVKDYRGDQIV